MNYQNTAANTGGKVFLEDFGERFQPQFPVKMWARQYNPEVQPENERDVDNPGGQYWILGLKTEGRANIVRTTAGGSTEILGGLIYPASSFSGTTQQAFTVQDASLSIAGLTMTSYINNGWYGTAVQETQNNVVRTLPAATIWTTSPYNFSFYLARQSAPTAAAARISGRVTSARGRGLANVRLTLQSANGASRIVQTNSFGFYSFADVPVGAVYVLTASSKRYVFVQPMRVISVSEEVLNADFVAEP